MIKDENIKNTLKNWANINGIDQVICYIGDYDHGGICLCNNIVEFVGYPYRLGIQFENKYFGHLKNRELYTIKDLLAV